MPLDPVVEASGLTKVYSDVSGDLVAVDSVDLVIAGGEFVAVMGPSGCGKSTLLHLLGALTRPTSGTVSIAGRRLDDLSDAELALVRRHEIGFVFQSFNLVTVLTVRENVALPAQLAGEPERAWRQRVDELIESAGLAAVAGKPASQLSGASNNVSPSPGRCS